jgi:hypothetical protein
MNAMLTIEPYKEGTVWYFDDPRVGVKHEPFVGDINRMIDRMVKDAKLVRPEAGFHAMFSDRQFPGAMMVMRKIKAPGSRPYGESDDFGGAWYKAYGMEGWLCPVLNRYFQSPPSTIYARAEAIPNRSLLQRMMDYIGNWMYRHSIEIP